MPATIAGIVFNDLNHSGTYTAGEPGIANVYVVLQDTAGSCTNVQTDTGGNYSFTNITVAGTYTVYESVVSPNACPPTVFTQPTGFNDSTTARKIVVTVTATQVTNNTTISGNNFGHDNLTPFGCQSYAWQVAAPSGANTSQLNRIDLATGGLVNTGNVTTGNSVNAMGYNATDGNLYGWNNSTLTLFRLTPDRVLLNFPSNPNIANSNTGDVNENGYLYLYATGTTSFYVIDVNPNRSTFLKIVDPTNGFVEKTAAPYGTTIISLSCGDWSFNPRDGQLYLVNNATFAVQKVNPTTGVVTNLTTTGVNLSGGSYGGTFFDNYNNLYALDNNTGNIYKIALSGNSAVASLFSSTGQISSANDGARCPTAPIFFATLNTTKTATPIVGVGDTISYTIVINNVGNTTATSVVLIDTMPEGTIFNSGSIKVDGSLVAGDPSPPTGANLGTLSKGVHTVTFTVTVVSLPTSNPVPNTATGTYGFLDGTIPLTETFNTNIASTTINYVTMQSVKSVTPTFAAIGTTIDYTIVFKNTGITTAQNIIFIDTIPASTTFISGTLKQDGANVSGTPNPPGVTLPNSISVNQTTTVIFSVRVDTVPVGKEIPNNAAASFQFLGNPTIPTTKQGTTASNTVTVNFNQALLEGIKKATNKTYADCGDTITYTVTIPNTGNVTATNIIFKDTIPSGTSFVNDSVYVNGSRQLGANPQGGISVADLSPGGIATITFDVKILC